MTRLFADTFYFLALLNPHDEAHTAAVRASQMNGVRLVTSAWVLTEVADGLAGGINRTLFSRLLVALRGSSAGRIVMFSRPVFDEAVALYDRRRDKQWSLTDCTSFVIMKRIGLTDALTGDRHFEQAGFRALLRRS